MSNRRFDLVLFAVLLLVVGFGYLAASRGTGETENLRVPDFSLPPINFELPLELPFAFVEFARPEQPKLVLSENMESVMVEVRSALLVSSEPVEIPQDAQLAGVLE